MQIAIDNIETTRPELDVLNDLLDLDDKVILELGCGAAEKTRAIATTGRNRRVIATEVDEIQLSKNLQIDDLPNVEFIYAGAERLPLEEDSVDIILMFKSLHHVPVESMDQAFIELHRVLRPGGLIYIEEPLFAGSFNDILKLFHDEQAVRVAAFEATKSAVSKGLWNLVTETFFNTTVCFDDFDDFSNRVIQATHSDHQLSAGQYGLVRRRFEEETAAGNGNLTAPMRVDLLQKAEVPR